METPFEQESFTFNFQRGSDKVTVEVRRVAAKMAAGPCELSEDLFFHDFALTIIITKDVVAPNCKRYGGVHLMASNFLRSGS